MGAARVMAWAIDAARDTALATGMAMDRVGRRMQRMMPSPARGVVTLTVAVPMQTLLIVRMVVVLAWAWGAVHVKAAAPAWAWDVAHVKAAVPAWGWDVAHVKAMDPAWAWDAARVKAAVPVWVWDVVHVKAMDPAWGMGDIGIMDRVTVVDQCTALAVTLRRNNAAASLVKRCL